MSKDYDLLPIGKYKNTKKTLSYDEALELLGGAKPKNTGVLGRVGDATIDVAKGVVGLGESAIGVGDIATGGRVGKLLNQYTGYDPKRTKQVFSDNYSNARQQANQEVENATGFVDTLSAMVKNPSTILGTVLESAPSMLGGGAAAQGMGKLGLLARNPVARGAIGEGLVAGGQSAEQIRQENPDGLLTPKQSLAAGLSGVTTGAIGFGGGKLAQKLGILDPQTILAGGGKLPKGLDKHTFSNVLKGFVSEGALQELPQSATEQMWQNYAQDKPLLEGVPEAAATGLLAGGVMGAGANLLHRRGKQTKPAPKTTKELLRLGYDNKYKLGYEDLPTAPDVIYQGTDYQAPLQLPYEQPLRIGYEGLQPAPDVIYQGTDSPRLELPSPSQVEPYTPNSNPNLSNAYDPVTEGLMRQADNYGMPEPKPTGTIGKALYAGGVTQQAINQPLAQGEIATPLADNLNSDNQSNGDSLPKRYPLNSRQKQVSIKQLKEIVKSRNGNINTVELMEYTGSNHLQAARAINDVRHEINTLNREFDKFTEAKRAIKKLDKNIPYRAVKNPDTGMWRVTSEPKPLTQAEIENIKKQEAKKQRQLQRKRINPEKDSLLTAIIKLGGISTDWRLDTTADSKGNKNVAGVGYLWSDRTGASIDDVARRLADEGYIPASAMSNDEGVRWLQEAIKEELTLGTKHYALNSEKALAQQYEQALLDRLEHEQAIREDEYLAIREQYGIEAEQQARFYDEYATNYFQNLEEQFNELEQQTTIIEGQAVTQADSTAINDQLREYDQRTNSEQTTTNQPTQETDSGQSGQQQIADTKPEQPKTNEKKQDLSTQTQAQENTRLDKIIKKNKGKMSIVTLAKKAKVQYDVAAEALAKYPEKQLEPLTDEVKLREIVRENYNKLDEIAVLEMTNATPEQVRDAFWDINQEQLLDSGRAYKSKEHASDALSLVVDKHLFKIVPANEGRSEKAYPDSYYKVVKKTHQEIAQEKSANNPPEDTVSTVQENTTPFKKSNDTLFRREQNLYNPPANRGIQATKLNDSVTKVFAQFNNAPKINTVQSLYDLPPELLTRLRNDGAYDLEGAYHNGQVYLVADNISNVKHGLFIAEHEILGHYGLRGLFGNRLKPLLNNIYHNNQQIKRQADKLIKQFSYSREIATEEILADMAANKQLQKLTLWHRILAAFRNFSRKLGLPVSFSANDIANLLANARSFVRGINRTTSAEGSQYSRASQRINQGINWLDDKLNQAQPLPDRLSKPQRKILKEKFAMYQSESIRDKAWEITSNLGQKFIQGVFDSFAPLKALSERGYMQAHLSKGTEGAVEAILHIGKPKLTDGALDVADDTGGLFAVLAELNSNGTNELNEWLAWMSANRAAILKEQGRENLFTDNDIAELKKLSDGTMPDGRSRIKVYNSVRKQFNAYNNAVLDIAEQSGLIDPENRKTWENGYYLPFYRIAEDDNTFSIGQANKIVGQKAFHKLKGGTQALDDLLVNIVSNWSHLLTASMKNQAAVASLKGAVKHGVADKLSRIAAGEYINKTSDKFQKGGQNVVWVMEEGKQKYYQVNDPLVFDALNMINNKGWHNPLINTMGAFKKALTIGVTSSPAFRITSLLRDSLQAMAITDLDYNPINNIITGFKATKSGSETLNRLIASGGAIRFGAMYDGSHGNHLRNLMKELTIKDSQILNTPDKVKHALFEAWDWYKELGDRGENINRAAIYERARAKGKNHLQASFEARDLMNFTSSGKWAAVRFLAQTLPFFNARLQGLYKLGRGAMYDPKRFALVAGGVALASSLLYLLQKDDDDYQELPDYVRDNYWYIKLGKQAVYIPKPFEVGALGSIVERGLEYALADSDYTAKDFASTLLSLVSDQLAMNPIPQIFKPIMEASFNYDSFRGANIDNMGQQRLAPRDRYTANTNAGAIGLGKALNMSPQRLEHLVRGYFGWLGTQVLNLTDIATRPLTDLPSNPQRDLTKVNNYFLVGNFVRNTEIGAGSKYLTRFYDTQQEINQVYASLSNARKIGELEYAKELAQDDKLKLRRLYNTANKGIDNLNKQIRAIRADKELSASEKNNRISVLQHQRNQLAKLADQRARASGYL